MALQLYGRYLYRTGSDVWKFCAAYVHNNADIANKVHEEVKKASVSDLPIEMENPFVKEKPQCILCKYNIDVNYKNVRLLSQFVSKFTGRIYGRHITGLCEHQHSKVEEAIKWSRISGLMGGHVKHPNFLGDPDLYDVTKPFRVL